MWRGRWSVRVPRLLVLTDPARMPDPVEVAARLPAGSGLVYRHFGAADRVDVARRLRDVTRAQGCCLLMGGDAQLALDVGADGVHWPERMVYLGQRWRAMRPDWVMTGAAHGRRALVAASRFGLDGALVSPVFPSHSASAGRALGVSRFGQLCAAARVPVYALGGVGAANAGRLRAWASGFAVVEAAL